MRCRHQWIVLHSVRSQQKKIGQRRKIASLPFPHPQLPRENIRPRAYLDFNLMAYVLDVPLQEVRDLLDRGAECEAVPKLSNVNRGPGPCMLSAHGQPPLCVRLCLSGRAPGRRTCAALSPRLLVAETPCGICSIAPNFCSAPPLLRDRCQRRRRRLMHP